MQKIAHENIQALANYENKSVADTNAVETLKKHIIDMKAEQTVTNENISNLTVQVSDTRQDYSSNNNQQGGWYNWRKDQCRRQNQ